MDSTLALVFIVLWAGRSAAISRPNLMAAITPRYFEIAESLPVAAKEASDAPLIAFGNSGFEALGYTASERADLRQHFGQYMKKHNIIVSPDLLDYDGPWPVNVFVDKNWDGSWSVDKAELITNALFVAYTRNTTFLPSYIYTWNEGKSNYDNAISFEENGYGIVPILPLFLPYPFENLVLKSLAIASIILEETGPTHKKGKWKMALDGINFAMGRVSTCGWKGLPGASTEGESGTLTVGFAAEETEPGIWVVRAVAAAFLSDHPLGPTPVSSATQ